MAVRNIPKYLRLHKFQTFSILNVHELLVFSKTNLYPFVTRVVCVW